MGGFGPLALGGGRGPQGRQGQAAASRRRARVDPPRRSREAHFFVEYDRTGRVDKNFEKFRRYDAFLCWWWRHTGYLDRGAEPWVLFVCQDEDQRDIFLEAADRELTGHRWHPSATPADYVYTGRRRILFANEHDAHAGVLEARRVAAYPPGHPARHGEHATVRRVRLPGPHAVAAQAV